jgi:thioredoxin 1
MRNLLIATFNSRTSRFIPSTVVALVLCMAAVSHARQMPGASQAAPMKKADQTAKMAQADKMNGPKPFSKEAFNAAAAEGKTILVEFHAPWCPICRAQQPKLQARLNGDYKHVVAFRVDYDTNVELRKEMNVAKQSTLILFKGSKELGRLSYTSDDKAIDDLFAHAKMM